MNIVIPHCGERKGGLEGRQSGFCSQVSKLTFRIGMGLVTICFASMTFTSGSQIATSQIGIMSNMYTFVQKLIQSSLTVPSLAAHRYMIALSGKMIPPVGMSHLSCANKTVLSMDL